MMAYHQDGIVDIYAGLIVIMFGLFLYSGMPWLAGAFVAIFVPLIRRAKMIYTAPRLNRIQRSPNRQGGFQAFLVSAMILGILALSVGVLVAVFFNRGQLPTWLPALIDGYGPILLGICAGAVWGMAGFFVRAPRFYGYAGLSVLLPWLGTRLGLPLGLSMIALGGIVLLSGTILLLQFLARYPIETEGVS